MSKEEILRAGIAAAKSGDLQQAAALFAQLVKADPSSEQGWFLLGMCCSAPDQREYCFRRVLALNPNNLEAKQQLTRLARPAPKPPPIQPSPSRAPAEPRATPEHREMASAPPARTEQPSFTDRVNAWEPVSPPAPPVSPVAIVNEPSDFSRHELSSPPADDVFPRVDRPEPERPKAKQKKPNRTLVLLMLAIPTLLFCGLGVGYLILSGQLAEWISPSFAAIATPVTLPGLTTPVSSLPPTTVSNQTPVSATAIPSPKPTVTYTPRLEETQCPFDIPAAVEVSCGYMIVPEDRTGDPAHTIKLAYAVYHSTSSNPAPYPVVFLQGGPGGEAVKLSANAYRLLVAPFLTKRDFIAFDQRGTGLSEPVLKCDELTKTFSQDIHGLIPGTTRNLVYSNSFLSCQGLMSTEGVNLNAYTTVASAADTKDLLNLLGYQKADLYGASYGTRLAQVIMRDYPDIVHSVVLDSVVPVEANLFSNYPDAIEYALKTLFDGCTADSKCNTAYPQLEATFWDLMAKLDANPVKITTSNYPTGTITESVDGSTFMAVILGSMKQSALISTTPQTIYRFKDGDYSTLIVAQSSLPFAFEGISPGLYISMMCHEHVLATSLEDLQAATAGRQDIREYAWLPFYGSAADLFKTCKSWGASGPRLGENDPVTSDIPTLIITGKYDPTTPPIFAQQIAGRLSHSYYFEFPNQGHTPTAADSSGCAMDTVLAFLDDPSVEPGRSCLDRLSKVHFLVPYTGTPTLQLRTADFEGISAKVPEDWHPTGDGFYFRGNSPLDITQVGLLQANVSAAKLEDWFSSKAYGYRGLDTALIQAGQREATSLTWTLYTSSSYGRPVDIAMADYGGRSLVVMLFCNSDEHDAIYQTVFLPMIDSTQP